MMMRVKVWEGVTNDANILASGRGCSDAALAKVPRHCLRAGAYVQFLVNMADVCVDRGVTEPESLPDLLVEESAGQQFQHLCFAR